MSKIASGAYINELVGSRVVSSDTFCYPYSQLFGINGLTISGSYSSTQLVKEGDITYQLRELVIYNNIRSKYTVQVKSPGSTAVESVQIPASGTSLELGTHLVVPNMYWTMYYFITFKCTGTLLTNARMYVSSRGGLTIDTDLLVAEYTSGDSYDDTIIQDMYLYNLLPHLSNGVLYLTITADPGTGGGLDIIK